MTLRISSDWKNSTVNDHGKEIMEYSSLYTAGLLRNIYQTKFADDIQHELDAGSILY